VKKEVCPHCGQESFMMPIMDATNYSCGTSYSWMTGKVTFSDKCIQNQNKNKKENDERIS
jgi:ribosomal protein S27AE